MSWRAGSIASFAPSVVTCRYRRCSPRNRRPCRPGRSRRRTTPDWDRRGGAGRDVRAQAPARAVEGAARYRLHSRWTNRRGRRRRGRRTARPRTRRRTVGLLRKRPGGLWATSPGGGESLRTIPEIHLATSCESVVYASAVTQDNCVAVVGLGYVGLPLAISFAEAGLQVEGIDVSAARIAELHARHSPIDDITDERLARRPRRVAAGRVPGRRSTRGRRRGLRLRADADQRHQGPRPRAGPRGRDVPARPGPPRASSSSSSRRRSRAPRPGRSARSSRPAACAPASDFDLAFAPERVNPGDPASAGADGPAARRRDRRRRRRRAPRPCSATSTTASSSSRRRTPPSSPSCSRTCSAT